MPSNIQEGLTVRLAVVPRMHDNVFLRERIAHFFRLYQNLSTMTVDLGAFQPNLWDRSATAWATYARGSTALKISIARLIKFADLQESDDVLDVGSASGESAMEICPRRPKSLVLMDSSPQMIAMAGLNLSGPTPSEFANTSSALGRVSYPIATNIDLDGREFSLIIFHQSLPAIVSDVGYN